MPQTCAEAIEAFSHVVNGIFQGPKERVQLSLGEVREKQYPEYVFAQ